MGKRYNNEGTIYYRADRREWSAQITLNDRRITKYAKTHAECREWVKEMLKKISNGLTYEGMKVTLEKFTASWLEGKKLAHREKTYLHYRTVVNMHILPILGKMRLQEIQPAHLKKLYIAKREEGRGDRTVQMIHTVLHGILQQALKEGILSRNPADAVERPRFAPKEMKILNEEQTRRLIIAGKDLRVGMPIYMALMTGMREGELLGLKWSDLDWEKGRLSIQRQLQPKVGVGLVFVPPKTKAGTRKIFLGQATLEALAKHREDQDLIRRMMKDVWEENDLIFPNYHGKPWAQTQMAKEFKQLLKQTGLPNIRFHDLRHTSITLLLENGTPVNSVQQRVGHSKASITTDIYGHSLSRVEAEAAEKLEELLTPVAVKLQSN